MSPTTTTTAKKTTRVRKTAVSEETVSASKPISSTKNLKSYESVYEDLFHALNESKEEFTALQKEIDQVRESWLKEQRDHVLAILERNQQEEIARKRENETYAYETTQSRRQAEDEFSEKKIRWEKELEARKEEIAKDKQELEDLRKQVAGFEAERAKAVKEATDNLKKDLSESFATETKLREQEIKSEKELLALKIATLTQENARQSQEIITLKKSLENATVQLKDVAVKVIESSGNKPQASGFQES